MSDTKPREHWFHIDDSRTAEECKGRSDTWRPFIERSACDKLAAELAECRERADALQVIVELQEKQARCQPDFKDEYDNLSKFAEDLRKERDAARAECGRLKADVNRLIRDAGVQVATIERLSTALEDCLNANDDKEVERIVREALKS
jgi:hypothetical protein